MFVSSEPFSCDSVLDSIQGSVLQYLYTGNRTGAFFDRFESSLLDSSECFDLLDLDMLRMSCERCEIVTVSPSRDRRDVRGP
mmetsp:Transcript_501/g.1412  ORF Transcript_501/g.1412 Transcript_501/m.1412 type:complete len:82 (-) Transcript_501:778-1023(-)